MKDWIPIIAALIAATVAVTGYMINARLGRLKEKERFYAEALAAVQRYHQLPYWFYRLHDGTSETRAELAKRLGETQELLAFHRRWLELDAPRVGAAYSELVEKIHTTNSGYRKDALASPPPSSDADIEIASNKYKANSDVERVRCVAEMRRELRLVRWPRKA